MVEYAWPEILRPTRLTFYLQHNTTRFVSPITRQAQVLRREGARWVAQASFEPLDRVRAGILEGLLAALGNPALATGAPRGALSIQTQGWYPNAIAIGAGDMIGLAGRLYIATEAITASGTGTASIPIAPPLREALLVNQPLVLTKPTVPMRLVSDDEAANPTRPGRFTAITIRLEEAL